MNDKSQLRYMYHNLNENNPVRGCYTFVYSGVEKHIRVYAEAGILIHNKYVNNI